MALRFCIVGNRFIRSGRIAFELVGNPVVARGTMWASSPTERNEGAVWRGVEDVAPYGIFRGYLDKFSNLLLTKGQKGSIINEVSGG